MTGISASVSTPPAGFLRAQVDDVRVDDMIWCIALQQSRTGLIVRAPLRGQVMAVWPVVSRILRRTSALTLEVMLESGAVRCFPMRRRDPVYVQEGVRTPGNTTRPGTTRVTENPVG